jgi:hypothetical protein
MPIQFPTNPEVNQEYTYEGKVWQWDGSAWVGVRQETGIQRSNIWSKQNLLIPKRGFGLNSGYSGVTDQRRTQAGTIPMLKHYMERNLGVFSSTPLWTPALISTSLWLDASDSLTVTLSGSEVTQWNDKSGNGLNCSQATSANRPIIASAAQNSLNTIRFVASDYLSASSNITLTTAFTVFIVAKNRIRKDYNGLFRIGASALPANDVSNLEIYWQAGSSNSGNIVTTGNRNINFKGDQTNNAIPDVNNYYIHSSEASGTNLATRYQNGIVQASSQTFGGGVVVPSAANPYHVGIGYPASGNAAAAALDGDICEIVVLNTVASTTTRQQVEGYLAHKWGLTSNLPIDHPYKSVAP